MPPWAEHVQFLNTEERRRNGENGGRDEEDGRGGTRRSVERTEETVVETRVEAGEGMREQQGAMA
jgi:hypothetical protein